MSDKNSFFECLPSENEERKQYKIFHVYALILTINDYIFTVVKEKNDYIKVAQR